MIQFYIKKKIKLVMKLQKAAISETKLLLL